MTVWLLIATGHPPIFPPHTTQALHRRPAGEESAE